MEFLKKIVDAVKEHPKEVGGIVTLVITIFLKELIKIKVNFLSSFLIHR